MQLSQLVLHAEVDSVAHRIVGALYLYGDSPDALYISISIQQHLHQQRSRHIHHI